jgi:phenylacetate-CoA ligase
MYDVSRKYWDPKIELMNLKEIKILQERRLRRVVDFVYSRSPFYRRKFDEVGLKPKHIKTLKDINKIPLTNKYEFRDSYARSLEAGKLPFSEFITVPEGQVVTIHASSGTTGIPFSFPYLEREITEHGILATGEHAARQFWAAGLRPGDILAHIWNLGGAMAGGGNHIIAKGACIPELFLTMIPCHVGNTEKILQIMKDVNATAMICTPSYAVYMPEVAKNIGIDLKKDIHLKAVVTGGEPGGASIPGLRDKLKGLWGAEIFDMYGGIGTGLDHECEAHSGFHIQSDIVFVQVIDPETKEELPQGEYGSLVGTGLELSAFPVLRFDSEDRGAISEERCECGRTHPRILSVPGRWDDMIKIKGFQLHPNSIEKVVNETKGCSGEFLVILDKDESQKEQMSIKVEYEPDVEDIEQFREKLEHHIRVVITFKANVEMVPKGTLNRYVMKKQRVIDNRSKEKKEKFEDSLKVRSADYFDSHKKS